MLGLARFGTGVVLALASIAVAADEPSATQGVQPPVFRLPAGARPLAYDLTLTIVPGEPSAAGRVAIDVDLDAPHRVLWLHADTLSVEAAEASAPGTKVSIIRGREPFVGLAFDPPLRAGRQRVSLSFVAPQAIQQSRGLFRIQEGGRWYAMTHFEATHARKAFPSFDEPGFKTPYRITLRVPRDQVAISNAPVESETIDGDGLKTVRFKATPPLPTYLVAFAVGPWETIDIGRWGMNGTPTRIVVPAGRAGDAAFATNALPQLFTQLERWFGIAYPYEKLDHVAIPLGVGFAMENVAMITYGASILLARPGEATARFRRNASNIGAHEIAHQWFGNLVTPAWWDDIWLNEAFATWIAERAVDRWRPDYHRGAARVEERATAIDLDVLASARRIREPVVSHGDIRNAFDSITYEKGATVIGMFETWIGEEPFRTGVQRYLTSRAGGSATATDFLDALTQASGHPVAPAFETFLNQNGVPRIDVRLRCDGGGARLELQQRRLATLGALPTAQRWQVPVCARTGPGEPACTLMSDEHATLPLGRACPAYAVANAGGSGYYVAHYGDGGLDRLARHRSSLSVAEFASLLDDLKALVRAGAVSPEQSKAWIRYASTSRDWAVVRAAVDLTEFLSETVVGEAKRPAFTSFVRSVFGPRARALGFVPGKGERDDDQLMRRALLRLVGPLDPTLAAESRRLARAWIADRKAVDPGLVDVVLVAAARTGDAALLDVMLAAAKGSTDRLERQRLSMALLSFEAPGLSERGMGILVDPAFDSRETWTALWYASRFNFTRRATYDYIVTNFDALAKTVGPETPAGWVGYAAGRCTTRDRDDVEAFWRERVPKYPGAARNLAGTLESIELCTRLRAAAR